MNKKYVAAIVGSLALIGGGAWTLTPTASADAPSEQPPAGEGVVTYERGDIERASETGATPSLVVGATDVVGTTEGLFHPVPPCRVYDTRFTTNPNPPVRIGNTLDVRSFNVIGFNFTSQGGVNADCGIARTATAVHLNLAVTGQLSSANAFAVVWPFGVAQPLASTLNYQGPNKAIANALTVKICRSATNGLCANDLRMTGSQPTHMFVDVLGYYEPALTAQVKADGSVQGTSLALASVTKLFGVNSGAYELIFDRNVSKCVHIASVGTGSTSGSVIGQIRTEDRVTNVNGVFVQTQNSAGAVTDMPFQITLHC